MSALPCRVDLADTGQQIFPDSRSHSLGPGVEMHDLNDPIERKRRSGEELDELTSME